MKKSLSIVFSLVIASVIMLFSSSAFADTTPIEINSDNTTVELNCDTYTYSGYEKKPMPFVTYNSTTVLEANTDYTVSYTNNVDAGTGKVIVTGIGNYSGELVSEFTINPKSISPTVSLSYKNTTYNGKELKPAVTVKYGDITLDNTTYKVSYKNNVNPGVATVTVTGTGNYMFSKSSTFTINPGKVTGLKQTSATSNSVTISWTKFSNATETHVYIYDSSSKKYKYLAAVPAKSNSYTFKNLSSGKEYTFKFRAIKRVNKDVTTYSAYAYAKGVVNPSKVSINSVTKSGSSVTVKWNKTGATGYIVCYTTDSKFKNNIKKIWVKNSSANSYTIKNLNKKSTYYCRVQAYITGSDNKNHYGAYSNILSTYYSCLYASYSSKYVNNANRTTNLIIASKAIDGKIIQPGETFSFNRVVGERTSKKGYKPAPIFAGSGTQDGIGGGICQVASTMFNCALMANVKITERHQHNQRVAYVPLGRDAAIYWGSQDFKWTNNTKYPIKIRMSVSNGTISCKFYTCYNVKPKKVSLKVTQSGKKFTLKRYVDKKCNYTTYSKY